MYSFSEEFNNIKGWANYLPPMTNLLNDIEDNVRLISPSELILPSENMIFNAFKHSTYNDISAVVVGQDPYHNTTEVNGTPVNQAMGLAFSVPKDIKIPPSLKNIYKELKDNFDDFIIPDNGDLSAWTSQVLLLNSSLTVEHSKPAAHAKTGWGKFSSQVIEALVQRKKPLVFLSWGKHAHKITECAEGTHHCVIKTSHPSPLGARKSGQDFDAFLGSKCFSRANDFLRYHNQKPVAW
ncbi:uracil-DNA glycosylase [Vibrio splendidus]|uniref:uracil-DNA glycosylase n=1 Tax=Vibrio splendidus TaxID=29497 RepID=UPI00159EF14C|nr:uracil-DNA glycosylase [Vibrio splendidus]